MLSYTQILDACVEAYTAPSVTAGPLGCIGALVRSLPDGGTLVAFRGTLDHGPAAFLDWLDNLRFALVQRDEYFGGVHHGFAVAEAHIWPMLGQLAPPLTLTGHSLGGALAQLCNTRLLRNYPQWRNRPPRVVTVAAPQWCDFICAIECERFCPPVRFENPHDLVPRLPPIGYCPVGVRIAPESDWQAPRGIVANHAIDTGYRPWIEQLAKVA